MFAGEGCVVLPKRQITASYGKELVLRCRCADRGQDMCNLAYEWQPLCSIQASADSP